jgi:hypothetical protein
MIQQQAENAIKWIDDLLVTTAKQGECQLGDESIGFCCLGRGCHVLGIDYDSERGSSKKFRHSVGLLDRCGHSPVPGCGSLIHMNDIQKLTFAQIADHLIQNADAYFLDGVWQLIQEHYQGVYK